MSLVHAAVASSAVLLAPLKGQWNETHGEWDRLQYGPVKLWLRDQHGRPRLFGIPFPRLLRGPRKEQSK